MSAALIWIILPGIAGLLMILLRNSGPRLFLVSAVFSLVLTWIAWQIPIDSAMQLGPATLKISSTLTILGRDFTILDNERPMIGLIFLSATLWQLGGYLARPTPLFIGISHIIVALLVAALSVEPFLYAAMLIGIAVLVSVPLLSSPGKPPGAGLLRFITFQLFGIPFILFVGWLLTGVEASPGNVSLVLRAGILLGLGFVFLLAVFPFHSWIPMLAREGHPYIVGFLLLFLSSVVSLFALSFFDRFVWLRETELVFQLLIAVGALVSLLGGTWVAVQNHLGRQMGYAIVYEIGLLLMALGLAGHQSVQLTFGLIIARSIALLIWAIALSGLWQATDKSLIIGDLKRKATKHPFLLSGLVLAMFSFGGLPLTAGFAPKYALLISVWVHSPLAGAATLIGSVGLVIGGLRIVFVLSSLQLLEQTSASDEPILQDSSNELLSDIENPFAWLYLVVGGGLIVLIGLFPQLFFGNLASFLSVFSQLSP